MKGDGGYMTKSELIQYMSMIVDMEKHIYIQDRLIDKLIVIKNELGYKKVFSEPTKPKNQKIYIFYFLIDFFHALILGVIACVSIAILAWLIGKIFSLNNDLWNFLGNVISSNGFLIFLILFFYIREVIKYVSEVKKENDSNKKDYDEKLLQYKNDVANENRRIEDELVKKHFLEIEIQVLIDKRNQSKQVLAELYDLNILYSKYRNFVATSSILEYLESGICDTLEGRDGAYKFFEEEIRLDRIILKLDDAINQLSRIANTQALLHNQVLYSNQRLEGLIDSTNSMANQISSLTENVSDISYSLEQNVSNSAIAAYNAERTAAEMRYRNIKDNIYSYI